MAQNMVYPGKIHSQKFPQNKKQENINHAKEEANLSIEIQMLESWGFPGWLVVIGTILYPMWTRGIVSSNPFRWLCLLA